MENPYENETELENSFWGDVYHYMEEHGVSKQEAEKVVVQYDCYESLR